VIDNLFYAISPAATSLYVHILLQLFA